MAKTKESSERVSREFVQAQNKFNTIVASILSVSIAYHALSRRSGKPDQKEYMNNLTKQLRNLDNNLQSINKDMDGNLKNRTNAIVEKIENLHPSKIILLR